MKLISDEEYALQGALAYHYEFDGPDEPCSTPQELVQDGAGSWVALVCNECDKETKIALQIGPSLMQDGYIDYDVITAYLCPACFRKAMKLFEKES